MLIIVSLYFLTPRKVVCMYDPQDQSGHHIRTAYVNISYFPATRVQTTEDALCFCCAVNRFLDNGDGEITPAEFIATGCNCSGCVFCQLFAVESIHNKQDKVGLRQMDLV